MQKDDVLKFINEERLVNLAKNMIRIPSLQEEESELARFLEKYMKDNGIETEMMEVEKGRVQPIGRIKGEGGGYSLIFNGHMDVDVLTRGLKDPFVPRVVGRRLIGHGIFNMKAGVAAMIEAALAIKEAQVGLKGDLVVTPVVGECQGGVGTVTLIKRGITADFGLVPEPFYEFISTAHTGVMEIAITLRGRSYHMTRMELGINLGDKLAKVINAINNMKFTFTPDSRFPKLPRMMIGSIICGHGEEYNLGGASHLPDYCTIIVDVRFLPGMHPDEDIAKVLEKIKLEDPEFEYEMKVTPDDPALPGMPWRNCRLTMPFHDLSIDEHIVKVCIQNYKYITGEEPAVGVPPEDHIAHPHIYAGDDAAHLTKAGIPSLTFGPGGGWDAEPQNIKDTGIQGLQYVEIDSMVRVAKVFALIAHDICTESKE
ncbi:M20 family metallopeptidase [Chloroflexota bacterium]